MSTIKPKKKACKGIGKAKNFKGCGTVGYPYRHGLCHSCFIKFVQTPEGVSTLKYTFRVSKNKVKKKIKKDETAKKKEAKQKPYFEKQLQDEINKLARMVDVGEGCISCDHGHGGRPFTRKKDGGHFFSVGSTSPARYNLHNIYLQCTMCNSFLHANDKEYHERLIKKFGQEHFDNFVRPLKYHPTLKLTKVELQEAIKVARQIVREIKSGIDYSRGEINKKIGIYAK